MSIGIVTILIFVHFLFRTGSEIVLRKIRSKISEEVSYPWLPASLTNTESQELSSFSNIDKAPSLGNKINCFMC